LTHPSSGRQPGRPRAGGSRCSVATLTSEITWSTPWKTFSAVLESRYDIVLADYHLPGFSGLDAWEWVARALPGAEVPFVILSGAIGEATAVDAMHRGVSDYCSKQHGRVCPRDRAGHWTCLPPAVPRPRPTPNWPSRASGWPTWPSTCRPASTRSGPTLPAKSTTTSAARWRRSSSTCRGCCGATPMPSRCSTCTALEMLSTPWGPASASCEPAPGHPRPGPGGRGAVAGHAPLRTHRAAGAAAAA
jgi:hypothetical protein